MPNVAMVSYEVFIYGGNVYAENVKFLECWSCRFIAIIGNLSLIVCCFEAHNRAILEIFMLICIFII